MYTFINVISCCPETIISKWREENYPFLVTSISFSHLSLFFWYKTPSYNRTKPETLFKKFNFNKLRPLHSKLNCFFRRYRYSELAKRTCDSIVSKCPPQWSSWLELITHILLRNHSLVAPEKTLLFDWPKKPQLFSRFWSKE